MVDLVVCGGEICGGVRVNRRVVVVVVASRGGREHGEQKVACHEPSRVVVVEEAVEERYVHEAVLDHEGYEPVDEALLLVQYEARRARHDVAEGAYAHGHQHVAVEEVVLVRRLFQVGQRVRFVGFSI